MPHSFVDSIEALGVDPIQLPHAGREVGLRGLHQQVVMIGHQAVGMADPVKTTKDLLKNLEPTNEILV